VTLTDDEQQQRREWFRSHWQTGVAFNLASGISVRRWDPDGVELLLPYRDDLTAHELLFEFAVGDLARAAFERSQNELLERPHPDEREDEVERAFSHSALQALQLFRILVGARLRRRRLSFLHDSFLVPETRVRR